MGIKEDLSKVAACDARYDFDAYLLVLQGFEIVRRAQQRKIRKRQAEKTGATESVRKRSSRRSVVHIPGQKLCLGVRALALRQYGDLALPLLRQWGLHSTSDIGSIVYNLIASGDLVASPQDKRSDFDDVFDFEDTMGPARKVKRETP